VYLTQKQREIYEFIRTYIEDHDIAPSYEEIKERFGFHSLSTVFEHLRTLERKGAITKGRSNEKRAIQVCDFDSRSVSVPLVGTVAAGRPIVKRQNSAENGQIVVALVDDEVTIKRVYFHGDRIELRASNPEVGPIYVTRGQDFKVYGILVGLYRKYNM
jgi:repressor LexA